MALLKMTTFRRVWGFTGIPDGPFGAIWGGRDAYDLRAMHSWGHMLRIPNQDARTGFQHWWDTKWATFCPDLASPFAQMF